MTVETRAADVLGVPDAKRIVCPAIELNGSTVLPRVSVTVSTWPAPPPRPDEHADEVALALLFAVNASGDVLTPNDSRLRC